ncbi:unnamed protein product [Owenia fusiformis]|uniref:Neuroendocrine convertase 2 n=1 Tax=Owenia fusiformis TaxID=6347 RepID=A0A8J1U6P9_OWEFU|nr:unnamed protein product [Owenia fusiformis]
MYLGIRWNELLRTLCVIASLVVLGSCGNMMTNQWYVQFHNDVTPEAAQQVAQRNGFQYVGKVLNSPSEYQFQHNTVSKLRKRRSVPYTRLLKADPLVKLAVQQTGHIREKRGYKPMQTSPIISRVKRDIQKVLEEKRDSGVPNDPLYSKEWYLKNTGQAGGVPKLDLNVKAAWDVGVTGKGVTTAIMDDGVDYMHPDLYHNYNAEASYDFSSNDAFPYPRYTDDWFNSHGTRCAGEISARRDNGVCGVGVAYDSKIAGLRMLDQPYMTDLIEANSMGHMPDKIDIYSASWGPTDDGMTVDGPRNATMRAIVNGVNNGRGKKGSIYVWASGDGGPDDDCNCDGYAASMWTISINSATNDGQTAGYDESCSSTLASTFSNGKAGYEDAGVATTDLYGKCTTRHSGTSAAAPEAAGVFALALDANPDLTWRDMQHLTVLTSKRNHLFDPNGYHNWTINGAGLEFNHLFGYGVLDAGSIVDLALNWKSVPERFHCTAGSVKGKYAFNSSVAIVLTIDTDACLGQDNEIKYLEHVQSFISVKASRRGDLTMYLTSPMGTKSMILSKRPRDADSKDGFTKWPFMTTHSWAETPVGTWTLVVVFDSDEHQTGTLFDWTLMLHGSQESPYAKQQIKAAAKHSKLGVVKREHEKWSASKE